MLGRIACTYQREESRLYSVECILIMKQKRIQVTVTVLMD